MAAQHRRRRPAGAASDPAGGRCYEGEASVMAVESSGRKGNPRLYELIENAPKTGKSPTVWAWPQLVDHFKVAAQPVQGPWPPHQQPRPDPAAESMPVAVPDPAAARTAAPESAPAPASPSGAAEASPPSEH